MRKRTLLAVMAFALVGWIETCDRLQRYFRWEYDEFTWAVS